LDLHIPNEKKKQGELLGLVSGILTFWQEPVVVVDSAGLILELNEKAAKLINQKKESVFGRNLQEFIGEKEKILTNPESYPLTLGNEEYRILKLGAADPVTDNSSTLALAERQGLALSLVEIGTFDAIMGGPLIWDANLHSILELNPDFQGNRLEYFLGLIHPDDKKAFMERHLYRMKTPGYHNDEYRIVVNGETKYIQSRLLVIGPNPGEVTRIIGTLRDITRKRETESFLRDNEERLRLVINATKVGFYDWKITDNDLYWDKCLYQILEKKEDENFDKFNYYMSIIHRDDQAQVNETFGKLMDPANPRNDFYNEYRMVLDSGRCIHIELKGMVFRDSEGKVVRLVGTLVETTEKANAQIALNEALSEVSLLKKQLERENVYLREEIQISKNFSEIIFRSGAFRKILSKIEQVASTDATVLLLGETGTGKELIARAIHNISGRTARSLVKVNCAALPRELIESELFGHEKGAFTNAIARKIGKFELAHQSTIFLDEIGELPMDLQTKLLRVLQEGEFGRLGGNQVIKADVRVIAATNRDLDEAIKTGDFRKDLFYRLNVFPIELPPLRSRREDIPPLVKHFVKQFGKRFKKEITKVEDRTMEALVAYDWPGNVRELENVIERAAILCGGNTIHIDGSLLMGKTTAGNPENAGVLSLFEAEKKHILEILRIANGKINGMDGAAAMLKMPPSTLRSKMKKLGIGREETAI